MDDLDTFMGLTQTAWTGLYTLLTGALLLAALLTALSAVRQWKTAQYQLRDSRVAQQENNRPYVIVTIEPSAASPQLFDLVVRNIGKRPAENVTIKLDPSPVRAREIEGLELHKIKMLNAPILMLAPGQELSCFYDNAIDRRTRNDLPTSHEVSLTYVDTSGHRYRENCLLDIDALKGTSFASLYKVHDIAKSLKSIDTTLKEHQP